MIDSHAHLTSSVLYEQVDEILQRASSKGITQIVNICTDPDSLKKGLKLSSRYPWVYNTCAITPHDVIKIPIGSWLEEACPHLVAIGETGLDYYYEHSPREKQKESLLSHIELALKSSLPLVIHCRDAFDDFFEILDRHYLSDPRHKGGVLHCFTGTLKEAQEVIKRGFFLSLSGIVTFKKSSELQDVAKFVPLNQLLIETDAPYLAPHPYRGKQNEPAFLEATAQFVADLKDLPLQALADETSFNARKLFTLAKR